MFNPIKITITAYDGTAQGLLKYTTSPVKAEVFFFNKDNLSAQGLPTGYGAYILLGRKDEQRAIYVGMSKQLQTRLRQHASAPPDGIVWDRAIAIDAADEHFLVGAGSEYLEADLYQNALEAKAWAVANLTPVPFPACAEVDKIAYDNFLEEVYLLIEVAGYDIFQASAAEEAAPDYPDTVFFFQVDGYTAMAEQLSPTQFVLKKGAKLANKPLEQIGNKQVAKLRQQFQEFISPDYFTMADIQFNSPTAAAIFIVAYKLSGKKPWKNAQGASPHPADAVTNSSRICGIQCRTPNFRSPICGVR